MPTLLDAVAHAEELCLVIAGDGWVRIDIAGQEWQAVGQVGLSSRMHISS